MFYSAEAPESGGRSTQQLKTKAANSTACVQNGISMICDVIFDQSRERFRKPIPPRPAPMKFAVAFRGATQHRNESELKKG